MVFVADEVVTAAKLNLATSIQGANSLGGDRTFTNTGFLDLDALTGGAGSVAATIVTATTGTTCLLHFSCVAASNSAGVTILAYRVSGATTIAASDSIASRTASVGLTALSFSQLLTGLTEGSNVFELQARVTAGTGRLLGCTLIVESI